MNVGGRQGYVVVVVVVMYDSTDEKSFIISINAIYILGAK